MKKGDLKIDAKTVVHCTTEELANQVLTIVDKLGYKWGDETSFLSNNEWYSYKEQTCYNLTEGSYCNVDYYKNLKYKILEAEDFLKLHENNEAKTSTSNIDWEQRRWELIKEIYAKCCLDDIAEKQIELSVYYADEMIKQLKDK